jgi:hypothetical protein
MAIIAINSLILSDSFTTQRPYNLLNINSGYFAFFATDLRRNFMSHPGPVNSFGLVQILRAPKMFKAKSAR